MIQIVKGAKRRGTSIIIYSPPGWGKTTILSKIAIKKNGFLIQCGENALADIRQKWVEDVPQYNRILAYQANSTQMANDYEEFHNILNELYNSKEKTVETICIDGFVHIINALGYYVVKKYFGDSENKANEYDNKTKRQAYELYMLTRKFENLQEKGYNIVLSAHATLVSHKDHNKGEFHKYTISFPEGRNFSPKEVMVSWAANILFGEFVTTEDRDGNLISKRVIRTQDTLGWLAKTRVSAPETIECDVDTIIKLFF